MRGFSRWMPALLGLVVFVAPSWGLPQPKLPPEVTDKPSVVVRVRPIGELLKDAGAIAKLIDQEDIFNAVEPGLGPVLNAFDVTKPIGFYANVGPAGVDSVGILMLPVKNHNDLLAVLGMFGQNATEADGLYTVNIPNSPFPAIFRFHGGYAYATVRNTPDAEAAISKNKIYAPERLLDPSDKGLVSVTFNIDAIPNALRQKGLDGIDEILRQADLKIAEEKNPLAREIGNAAALEFAKKAQRLIVDGLAFTVRLDFDRVKEDMAANFRLTARKGSDLANEIAGQTGAQGVGAGLLGSPSAVQIATNVVAPESLKKTFEPIVDRILAEGVKGAKSHQADAKDLFDALGPTLKAGLLDAGIDLRGPRSNGLASILIGVRLKDGDKLEAAVRRIVGNLGENERKEVTLDAEKVGGVAIHRINAAKVDADMRAVVGEDPKAFVAFRKDLLVVAIGEAGPTLTAVKEALQSSPKASKVMQGQVSLRNVAVLAESKQEGTVAAAKKAFPAGTDDLIRYSITGGDAFDARISSSIRVILFATLADQTRRNR